MSQSVLTNLGCNGRELAFNLEQQVDILSYHLVGRIPQLLLGYQVWTCLQSKHNGVFQFMQHKVLHPREALHGRSLKAFCFR